MKYLFLLLLSVAGFNAYSQIAVLNADSARLGNPAGTGTVALHGTTLIKNIAEGNAADSVLVRGSDGAVRFVKRSSFGALGIPFSNGDNLPGSNYNGRFLFNTSLQKLRIYDAAAGVWKDALPGGNYVQLNPSGAQTGSMNITGGLTFTSSFFDDMEVQVVPNISTIMPNSDFYPTGGLDIKGLGIKFKNTYGNTYADFNPGNTTFWGRVYVVSNSNENRYIQNFNGQTQRTIKIYSDAISFEKQSGYISSSLKGDNITGNKVLQLPDENGELLTKESALSTYAILSNPAFTGTPTAPTAPAGSNNNILANTAYVHTAIANLATATPIPNLNQVLNSGNTSNETAVFGRLGIGGTPISGYAFSSISSGASNFNSFSSSQGVGEFGIYDNSFYFAAETVSDGIKFFGNANAFGLKVTNANAIHIPGLTASQSVQTNANKELISIANTGTGNNVLAVSPSLTGTPTAPTADSGTSTTQLATTEFVQSAVSKVTINTQTTNYTLVLADAGKFIQQNVSSANNVTIPANASVAFPIGTQILLRQMGTGQVTIVAASSVTLQSADNALKSRVQFAPITLIKVDTNTWAVMGDLTN